MLILVLLASIALKVLWSSIDLLHIILLNSIIFQTLLVIVKEPHHLQKPFYFFPVSHQIFNPFQLEIHIFAIILHNRIIQISKYEVIFFRTVQFPQNIEYK